MGEDWFPVAVEDDDVVAVEFEASCSPDATGLLCSNDFKLLNKGITFCPPNCPSRAESTLSVVRELDDGRRLARRARSNSGCALPAKPDDVINPLRKDVSL